MTDVEIKSLRVGSVIYTDGRKGIVLSNLKYKAISVFWTKHLLRPLVYPVDLEFLRRRCGIVIL